MPNEVLILATRETEGKHTCGEEASVVASGESEVGVSDRSKSNANCKVQNTKCKVSGQRHFSFRTLHFSICMLPPLLPSSPPQCPHSTTSSNATLAFARLMPGRGQRGRSSLEIQPPDRCRVASSCWECWERSPLPGGIAARGGTLLDGPCGFWRRCEWSVWGCCCSWPREWRWRYSGRGCRI